MTRLSNLHDLNLRENKFQVMPSALWSWTTLEVFAVLQWNCDIYPNVPDSQHGQESIISSGSSNWNVDSAESALVLWIVYWYSSYYRGKCFSLYANNLSDLSSSLSQLTNLDIISLGHNMFSFIPSVVFTLPKVRVRTIHNQCPMLN